MEIRSMCCGAGRGYRLTRRLDLFTLSDDRKTIHVHQWNKGELLVAKLY